MKKYGLVLMILLLFFGYSNLKASHVMGSEISWTCVGQDSFLMKLVVYRDCNGITLGTSPLTFKCDATGATITTLSMSVGTPVDVTPVCPSSCSRCSSAGCSFPFGVHKYIMQAIVKLGAAGNCCKIYISWEQCCRNAAITTGAGGANFYTDAILNRCQTPCDNSPVFSNLPASILCIGQDFIYNSGGYDRDVDSSGGLIDSLSYEWAEPLQSVFYTIAYTDSYAYNKPFYFLGFPNDTLPFPAGIHLDRKTGEIMFRPTISEITVMAIRINEYRKGKLIAQVRRDMQVAVISCTSNTSPALSEQNNIKTIRICPGDSVIFNFSTYDSNNTDTVRISWSNSLPGAIWTDNNNSVKHPSATLKWVPSLSQTGKLPYLFSVTAKDNACPVNGEIDKVFQVIVNDPIINIRSGISACVNGPVISLNNYVTVDGKSTSKGIWTSPSNGLVFGDKFNPAAAGVSPAPGWKIYFQFNDSTGCYNKDSAFVSIYDKPAVTAGTMSGDTVFCRNAGMIILNGQPSGGIWSGQGVSGDSFNTAIGADVETKYTLKYHYTDSFGCSNDVDLKIKVRPEPEVIINPAVLCFGKPWNISASYTNANGIYWYPGFFSDGIIMGNPTSATISYDPGINDLKNLYFWLKIATTHTDKVCNPVFDSIKINMSSSPVADFSANPTSGQAPMMVQFYDSSKINAGTITTWKWYFGDGDSSSVQNPVHTYNNPARYDVMLKVMSSAGCEDDTTRSNFIATSIDQTERQKFIFYPNPAGNTLIIENTVNDQVEIILTDILGRSQISKNINKGKNICDISSLKPGVYLLRINNTFMYRLVVE